MSLGKRYFVIAPLSGFSWNGQLIEFDKFNFKIARYPDPPALQGLETDLSSSERAIIRSVTHWLSFEYEETDIFNQSNIVILFLIALWLSVPTKTHVRIIFKFSSKAQQGKERGLIRCLDHFQWIAGQISKRINTEQIEQAFVNIKLLEPIILKKRGLWNALVLTAAGNMTTKWQVAFMNFSAAVETILTYKKGGGITKRLAKSYSCLTERNKRERNREYRRFIKLYGIRSDIVHGRIHRLRNIPQKGVSERRLEYLIDFSNLLRKLWISVLTKKSTVIELEKKDSSRELFFNKTEQGYTPPYVKI
jgi:hypothetical protein